MKDRSQKLDQWDYGILGVVVANPGLTRRQIYKEFDRSTNGFFYNSFRPKDALNKLLNRGEIFGKRWDKGHLYHYYVKALY
jgi:hypothetical protein